MKKIKNFICSCRSGGPSVDTLNEKSNGLTPVRRVAVAFIVIALMMTVIPTKSDAAGTATFSDVPPDNWAYPYVEAAAEHGWVNGVGNGQFNPGGLLSEAEFCAILERIYFPDQLRGEQVKDTSGKWWMPVMNLAWNKGLIQDSGSNPSGMDYKKTGTWNESLVNAPMKRFEVARILANLCTWIGLRNTVYPAHTYEELVMSNFPNDGQSIMNEPDYFYTGVALVALNGLMTGTDNGTFNGEKTMTRAEMATVTVRLYEKTEKQTLVNGSSGQSEENSGSKPNAPQTVPETSAGQSTAELPPFAFKDENETVQQMMDRLNAATPPYREGYLTNGKPITAKNIEDMLQQISNDWSEKQWDESAKYKYSGEPSWKYFGVGVNSSGCNSFAATVLDYLFGEDGPVIQHKNFDAIKPGDAVWIRDTNSLNTGHVVVVMGNGDLGACPDENGYFWVFDGNAAGSVGQPYSMLLGHSNGAGQPSDFTEPFRENSIVYTRYGHTE